MSWFWWEFGNQEGEMTYMPEGRKQNVFAKM
jgi:hypothetical protein